MFSSVPYIIIETLFLVTLPLLLFSYNSVLLKLRHFLLVTILVYIMFIATQSNLEFSFQQFSVPNPYVLIFYCLIPSFLIAKLSIAIHQVWPTFIVDTTKVINHPKFPRITPLILYPLLSVPIQEIIFRWFYINRLHSAGLNNLTIIIISSLIFGIIHKPFGKMTLTVSTFICGIWWGTLYLYTNSLWYPIIAHSILGNTLIWQALYHQKNNAIS